MTHRPAGPVPGYVRQTMGRARRRRRRSGLLL